MSKKELLARGLRATGLMPALRRWAPPELVVLAYHRIWDMGDEDGFPCDPELVSADRETFRRQMAHLRRHWNPVSLSAVIDAIDQGRPLPPRSVVVSFDDGHLDNHSVAFPVLREFDIPAIIFLATEYVDSGHHFWFDEVAAMFRAAPAGDVFLPGVAMQVRLSDVTSRRNAAAEALSRLKLLPDASRRAAVNELRHCLSVNLPPTLPSAPMTWAQVREMADAGIEFGSHTVSHPILAMLPPDEIRRELQESRAVIERETGRRCDLLAYPVGKSYAFNDSVVGIARELGYRAALSYIDGIESPREVDRFAIRRVAVERYFSAASFEARMLLPKVFL